ncbi:MAG: hypothetical protein IT422_07415 [Pirellulaceae bacterium]|jgi:hypothetical protein|nr:hypothetical protein [Pirellulaceae bacterium]
MGRGKNQQLAAISWVIYLILGSLVELGIAQEANQQPPQPVILQSNELNESSGVAQVGELLWTHNDSGDRPRLFAFATDGSLRGQFNIRGARALDWEDICAFSRDGKHYLAIGDVGDNSARRASVTLYVIEAPVELPASNAVEELSVLATFEVTYPTGPVNCEALAYDPLSSSFVLATKEILQCRLFRIPAPRLSGVKKVQAELIGELRLPLVTAGDISPDGKQMVLLTYGPGCLLQRTVSQPSESQGSEDTSKLEDWQTEGDQAVLFFNLPNRRQGESICFSSDGKRLWLTSEFIPTPLFEVPVPSRD